MTENTAAETATSADRFSPEYIEANRIQFNDNDFQDGVEGADPNGTPFVMIDVTKGAEGKGCACGCGFKVTNEKRNFLPGHDQRLMGILVRAHRENLEVCWMEGGSLICADAEAYGRLVLNENGQAKLARYIATEPKRARRGKKASAAATPAVEVKADPLPQTVKVGRWEYPVTDVERDGNGKVVKVHYTNKRNEAMTTTSWNKLV